MFETAEPIVTLTDAAKRRVLELRAAEDEPEELALFIELLGMRSGKLDFDLSFDRLDAVRHGDAVQRDPELPVVVASSSIGRLQGSTLELSRDLLNPTFEIVNPHHDVPHRSSPAIAGDGPGELTGDLADKIRQILEEQVNPSIAVHAGRVELAGLEGNRAFLRMGGSCVGCGMASVTLNEGIAAAIQAQLPEVEAIIDVTDHDSGTNPFYEPGK